MNVLSQDHGLLVFLRRTLSAIITAGVVLMRLLFENVCLQRHDAQLIERGFDSDGRSRCS